MYGGHGVVHNNLSEKLLNIIIRVMQREYLRVSEAEAIVEFND